MNETWLARLGMGVVMVAAQGGDFTGNRVTAEFVRSRLPELASRSTTTWSRGHQDGCTREQDRLTSGSLKTQIPPRDKRRTGRAPHDSAVGTKGAQS